MTWTAPQITRQGTMYATGERQMLEAWLDCLAGIASSRISAPSSGVQISVILVALR